MDCRQTGASLIMMQQNYCKYTGDGDALFTAYVQAQDTLSTKGAKYAKTLVVPTGFEPVLPT
jgi:hypothetical protein